MSNIMMASCGIVFFFVSVLSQDYIRTNEVIYTVYHWWNPPDSAQMIENRGYPAEKHEVTTADGYIITVFRIPFGKKWIARRRPPVILQHGILCSSDCWTIMSSEDGIAYRLADDGYDVWISNARGPPYGKNHNTLSPNDKNFWNYSVHELGYYDLPAIIDYVLHQTGYMRLTYIGHSQGTAQYFIMQSMRPEYNDKINIMAALGPIAFLGTTRGMVRVLSPISSILSGIAKSLGFYKVLERPFIVRLANAIFCGPNSIFRPLCNDIFFSIAGFDSSQMNNTIAYEIGNYCPTGASIKQLDHFAQLTKSGLFNMYDYGPAENINIYNSTVPTLYNLTKITSPIILYHGANDYLSSPPEVIKLSKVLPNLVKRDLVGYPAFNHLDYMWAIDINKLLNNDILKSIKKFQN